MNNPTVNYHSLMGLLQTYKKGHQLNKGMVNLVGGFGGHHRFKKGKKKSKEKKVQGALGSSQAKKVKADQTDAEGFYCKK